jgi:hypothetical protein
MSVSSVGSGSDLRGSSQSAGNDPAAAPLAAMAAAEGAISQSLARIASGTIDGNGVDTYA